MSSEHQRVLRRQIDELTLREVELLDELHPAPESRFRSLSRRPPDIREELYKIQGFIADRRVALAQIETAEAQAKSAEAQADAQAHREDASFWLRRFILSLAVGHGAAFFALATGALQNDDPAKALKLAGLPLWWFGGGLVMAGAVPGLMWAHLTVSRLKSGTSRLFAAADRTLTILWAALSAAYCLVAVMAFVFGVITCIVIAAGHSAQAELPRFMRSRLFDVPPDAGSGLDHSPAKPTAAAPRELPK